MAYEFHYTPTGTGVISGKEVLEQTEDAINDLGNTAISGVQEALDKAEQALTNSENAVDDAQTALNTANNAEGVAVQAQNDVSNLSETVTNLGNRETTAEGNIDNLQGRMTTAEGNITNLQGRMTTAEGNIGNLQTAVSTAQATANSAQQTATTARQQSYVFRYSSTVLVDSSTNSNALLDNTDNLKVGDKVIDSSGVIYSVTAIDTTNSTFTIGTALIDLAQDSDVVHKSGDETISGVKSFINYFLGKDLSGQTVDLNDCVDAYSGAIHYYYAVSNYTNISNKPENKPFILESKTVRYVSSIDYIYYQKIYTADYNASPSIYTRYYRSGSASWSNWIKDTDKFVTTDTAQTVSGVKTITNANLEFKSTSAEYGVSAGDSSVIFKDKNNLQTFKVYNRVFSSGLDNNLVSFCITQKVDNTYYTSNGIQLFTNTGNKNVALRPILANNNADGLSVSLGASDRKWSDVLTYKVNSVEPSSLSLPSSRDSRVDISSYFTDTSNGGVNRYTVPANGYIYLSVTDVVSMHILAQTSNTLTHYGDTKARGSVGQLNALLPVRKDDVFVCQWYTTATNVTLNNAYFIPCQGNV